MRLHIIYSTLLSFGGFCKQKQKEHSEFIDFETFQKTVFSSSGSLCVELQCRRAIYSPVKGLHVVRERGCDFPAVYPSEPAALSWLWLALAWAAAGRATLSVLSVGFMQKTPLGEEFCAWKMFGSHCLGVICYLLSLVQFRFPHKANFCYKF